MNRARWFAGSLLLSAGLALAGCVSDDPTPTPPATPPVTPAPTTPEPTVEPEPTEGSPTAPHATPEPALSLDLPAETDERRVSVTVDTSGMPADGDGRIMVTVTSAADSMITELVLRWPAALHDTLFPAPFVPSEERIRDGGPPLVQPWTKWVVGPGERGEPDGTVSLGYGPLLAGATLEIPLETTRRAAGPVAFDLQILAGEAILTLESGGPAELRVEVP